MPWFHRRSEDEKQRQEAEQARQRATVEALQAGDIPVAARERLEAMQRGEQRVFTSDLSVTEFALAREAGVQPISQVMGSSVYHVGWQYLNTWYGSGELQTVSQAYNTARRLALGRMAREATLVGADAVIGVHLRSTHVDAGKIIEFQAFGTAVRVPGSPASADVALSNLSGQDFWALLQAGYRPIGVAAGTTVYHVAPSWGSQRAMSGWASWYNQEIVDFSQGLYTARSIAMARVSGEARQLGAAGIVGVSVEQEQEEYEVDLGNDQRRTDMIFTFHVLGTAVIEGEPVARPTILPILKLGR